MLTVHSPGTRVQLMVPESSTRESGVVTGVSIRGPMHVTYEVTWWDKSGRHVEWFEEFEISEPSGESGSLRVGFR